MARRSPKRVRFTANPLNQGDHTEFRIASGRFFRQNSCIPMFGAPTKTPEKAGLLIRPSTDLVCLPDGGSPAMAEIISRSLAHVQTSKALAVSGRRPGEEWVFEIAPGVKMVMCWIPQGELLRKQFIAG